MAWYLWRQREIAIRMAVGASHPNIFGMVLRKALKLATISAVVGLAGGIAVGRAMTSLLYDVRPAEPLVYASTCAIVIAVGMLASFLPALRAAHLDPVVALKYE
jgi:putative ABC transport system permease protein